MSDTSEPHPRSRNAADATRPRLELPEDQDALRSLLDAIPVPMMLVRLSDSEILFVNRHVNDYFAEPATTIVGRKTTEFYQNLEDRSHLAALLDKQGYVHNFEVHGKGPSGKNYWVSVSLQALSFRNEACVLGGIVDLTKRKEAEFSFLKERRLLARLLDLHERDRQLIGFEIHDGIVQDMTAAAMFLEAASGDLERNKNEIPENFSRGLELLRGCIGETRRLIEGLQPPILSDQGVIYAIEGLSKQVRDKSGLEIRFSHDVQFDRLAPALEIAIYRVVQEALNNVWQHSNAEEAEISILQKGEHVEISVRDEGTGFDPTQVTKKRYGLMGMRERARLLGGEASIESAPGQGTRIFVSLPIADFLLPAGLQPAKS